MDDEQQINITYETLFDILRVEKGRQDIQELSPSFFADVVTYMKQKKGILQKKEHESGIDSFDEVKKIRIQFENIQRLIKEIYERREKKIIFMGLNASRTQIEQDTSKLLPQEKEMYQMLRQSMDQFRLGIMHRLVKGNMPTAPQTKSVQAQPVETKQETETTVPEQQEQVSQEPIPVTSNDEAQVPQQMPSLEAQEQTIAIKTIKPVEQFVDAELEIYGPFDPDIVTELPKEVAQVLIENGSAIQASNDA